MPILWLALVVLVFSGGLTMQSHGRAQAAAEFSTVDTLSRSLLVYRSAAAEFARMHPAFVGTPTDAVLNLPGWFRKPVGISSVVTAGRSYTYYPDGPGGLLDALMTATESDQVGVKRSGVLISPRSAGPGIALPAAIPEGAIVALN
jgi:hypothetical protein